MPGFGRFETVEQLASRGPVTVYSARPAGSDEKPTLVVKAYGGGAMMGGFDTSWDEHAAAFVETALFQKGLAEGGCKRWAPIIAVDQNEEAAYYVMKRYPLTAQGLVERPIPRDAASVAGIVAGVVSALMEVGEKASNRGHGNLKPANVLIELDGGLAGAAIFLTDPASQDEVRSDRESAGRSGDLKDVGRLLFQLVMRREPPQAGAIAPTPDWEQLSRGNRKAGAALRELCEQLLNPTAGPTMSLIQVRERLVNLPSDRSGAGGGLKGLLVGGGVAAAVVVGGAVWWFGIREKAVPVPDPIVAVPPVVDTPVVVTVEPLAPLATDWQKAEITDVRSISESIRLLRESRDVADGLVTRIGEADARVASTVAELESKRLAAVWDAKALVDPKEKQVQETKLAAAEGAREKLLALQVQFAALKKEVEASERTQPPALISESLISGAEKVLAEAKQLVGPDVVGGSARGVFEDLDVRLARFLEVQDKLRACQGGGDREQWESAEERRENEATPADFQAFADRVSRETAAVADGLLADAANRVEAGRDADVVGLPRRLRTVLVERLRARTLDGGAAEPVSFAQAQEIKGVVDQWLALSAGFESEVTFASPSRVERGPFDTIRQQAVESAIGEAVKALEDSKELIAPTMGDMAGKIDTAKEKLKARTADLQAVITTAEALDRKLAEGLMYEEEAPGGSIKDMEASLRSFKEYEGVAAAVRDILANVAGLAAVDAAGVDALQANFPAVGGRESISVLGTMRRSFARLADSKEWPTTTDQLDNAVKYGDALRATAAAAGVPTVIAAVEAEVPKAVRDMWVRVANGARADGANVEAIRSIFDESRFAGWGVGEAEIGSLSTVSKFNRLWLGFGAEVSRLAKLDDEAGQKSGIKAAAEDLLVRLQAVGIKRDTAALKDVFTALNKAIEGKGGGADFAQSGPSRAGWTAQAIDGDDSFVSYIKEGFPTLGFVRVGDGESFVGTTEISIEWVAALIDDANFTVANVRELLRGGEDKSSGLVPWSLEIKSDKPVFTVRAPIAEKGKDTGNGNGWFHLLTTSPVIAFPAVNPPTRKIPMTRVSPAAAAYLATRAGCRLPSVNEWMEASQRDRGTPNVRDAACEAAIRTLREHRAKPGFVGEEPDGLGRSFKLKKDVDGPLASAGSDPDVWFAPVPDDFRTPVAFDGNVSEFVVVEELVSSLNELSKSPPAASEAMKVMLGVVRPKATFKVQVIGRSAISPGGVEAMSGREIPPTASVGETSANGYADVGFRLAFTAEGGGSGGDRLAEAFYAQQFQKKNRFLDPRQP